ncbi:SAM-dependent methyltransferase [Micromonospora halophytica]|uniref:SAM-dependent methyltransferase, MidA family n=1 Tax=Micromonospora halophytica TaxID=47864 RepID=A0A1C5IDR4_9ACTN|nr:SAM-dependent methyltransferase [Micromonospora halophytica]SCG56588.1 SAM-dependent methyltransferase, MidA family [Micromonospora halophytica]
MSMRWWNAMDRALYGPGGFFVAGSGPAAHFRTSVHASPVFATALFRLLTRVDAALGHPSRLDLVDVGAGRGELLVALLRAVRVSGSPPEGPSSAPPIPLADRVRLVAVEKAPRPDNLPADIEWTDDIPGRIIGLLVATEWLDNVPLDVAVPTPDGWRYLLVDPTTGEETVGDPVDPADREWLDRWWPAPTGHPVDGPGTGEIGATGSGFRAARPAEGSRLTARSRSGSPEPPHPIGPRAEIGRTRDEAWAAAVSRVDRGLALAVDYGHLREERPAGGTLTGYRGGRQVPPVPDGSCDVTAHVAMDSVASAGERVARCAYSLMSQREALRALGADGGRPPLGLASRDPAGYVRALAAASTVAELTDPAGLGGHRWLRQPVGVAADPLMAR